MNKREFILALGGAAAWPIAGRAQQPAVPVIGFLSTASAASIAPFVDGFRRGLGAAGFAEGRNVAVEYRWADNRADRLPALAAELVARRVAVIVTGAGTAAALAAKAATSTIPIVFTIGADPVKFSLVDSMSRPGGNVTGASFLANDLVTKQLQLLQALLPPASVIGVLANPNNPNAEFDTGKTQTAAASLRLQVHVVNVAAARDIDAAFDDLATRARRRSWSSPTRCLSTCADGWPRSPSPASCLRSTATVCTSTTAG
jgi:putative ABC transport system substrate-binding protein